MELRSPRADIEIYVRRPGVTDQFKTSQWRSIQNQPPYKLLNGLGLVGKPAP
jgi:hypothetical protein